MTLQLIEGQFSPQEAVELLTQMIQLKIRFHEEKIAHLEREEDVKARETKIKRLQGDLSEIKKSILSGHESLYLHSTVNIG